jgi:hypothetical protein
MYLRKEIGLGKKIALGAIPGDVPLGEKIRVPDDPGETIT